ncbi:MAG: VCBS repeat-containing protein [Pseudoruegeria sp.]
MLTRARRPRLRALQPLLRRAALAALCVVAAGAAVAEVRIVTAEYADPTDRYTHGVLGDAIEYGSLVIGLSDGSKTRITLPHERVFEDIAPRIIALEKDGDPEVIVVESHVSYGARLSIYNQKGLITATPYIGTKYRWLAPVGAADLDGDGAIEIAYVDRPHLVKTLRIWRYADRTLVEVASVSGVSNHRIGEDFITGGVRKCGDRVSLITASGDWRNIIETRFDGHKATAQRIGPFEGAVSVDKALHCP